MGNQVNQAVATPQTSTWNARMLRPAMVAKSISCWCLAYLVLRILMPLQRSLLKITIVDVLDSGLPRKFRGAELLQQKCTALFEHSYKNFPQRSARGVCGM